MLIKKVHFIEQAFRFPVRCLANFYGKVSESHFTERRVNQGSPAFGRRREPGKAEIPPSNTTCCGPLCVLKPGPGEKICPQFHHAKPRVPPCPSLRARKRCLIAAAGPPGRGKTGVKSDQISHPRMFLRALPRQFNRVTRAVTRDGPWRTAPIKGRPTRPAKCRFLFF